MEHELALVTGATSGIGEALCQLFASKGIKLIATGRDQERLTVLQKSLEPLVEVQTVALDLSQPEDRQQLIDLIHHSAPDLVINNAGFGLYGEALTYTTQEQTAILEVNAQAVLELTLEAARTLVTLQKKGVIMNVSSVAGFMIFPNFAVYAASKAFVNHFSEAFDYEMQPYGVRVLSACPGMVATAFRERGGGSRQPKEEALTMTPDYVAKEVWWQIQAEQPLFIINWKYWLLTLLTYFIPKRLLMGRLSQNINKQIEPRTLVKIDL